MIQGIIESARENQRKKDSYRDENGVLRRRNCGRTLETFVKALGKTLPISCDCDMVMKGMSPSVKWWHALVLLRFTVTFSPYNLRTDLYGFSNIFLILSRYVHIAREFKVLDLLACVAPDMIFHAVISCHA